MFLFQLSFALPLSAPAVPSIWKCVLRVLDSSLNRTYRLYRDSPTSSPVAASSCILAVFIVLTGT